MHGHYIQYSPWTAMFFHEIIISNGTVKFRFSRNCSHGVLRQIWIGQNMHWKKSALHCWIIVATMYKKLCNLTINKLLKKQAQDSIHNPMDQNKTLTKKGYIFLPFTIDTNIKSMVWIKKMNPEWNILGMYISASTMYTTLNQYPETY